MILTTRPLLNVIKSLFLYFGLIHTLLSHSLVSVWTFHIKGSEGANISSGRRAFKSVFCFTVHCIRWVRGGKLKAVSFSFWKEVRSLKPVSCFWGEEVVVEVKVRFMRTMGAPGAVADLTFHSGFLCAGGPEQGCCLGAAPSPRLFSSAKLNSMSWRR